MRITGYPNIPWLLVYKSEILNFRYISVLPLKIYPYNVVYKIRKEGKPLYEYTTLGIYYVLITGL